MPAKTTKSTRAKSNVARATGKAGLLNKKVKFNWKIAAIIGIVLVGAVGYLFVRFSQAAAYTWTGRNILIDGAGTYVQKTDGRTAVQSVPRHGAQTIRAYVNSSVSRDDTYCFSGKNANPNIRYFIYYSYGPASGMGGMDFKKLPQGDFLVCERIAGRTAFEAPSGTSRRIVFYAEEERVAGATGKVFAVYQVGRAGR